MNKANIFMGAGWAGLAGITTFAVSLTEAVPGAIGIAGALVVVASCWVMLFTRNADEYTRGLWMSAASFAFAILLLLFLALPFAEGVYDGFNRVHSDGAEPVRDISAIATISCAIGAFYIGLFWKRLRGGFG